MDYSWFRQWCPPTRLGSLVHPGVINKAQMSGVQSTAAFLGASDPQKLFSVISNQVRTCPS